MTSVAIGNGTMGDEGVVAFCTPLEGGNGCGLEVLDFSLKQMCVCIELNNTMVVCFWVQS